MIISFSFLRKAKLLCASLLLIASVLTLSSCVNDTLSVPTKTKQALDSYPTTTITMYVGNISMDKNTQIMASELAKNFKAQRPLTRGIKLTGFGKVEAGQDFIATCYIINESTKQVGKFTYKWITALDKDGLLILKDPKGYGKKQNIEVSWISGSPTSNISGDKWRVCAVACGTEKQVKGFNNTNRNAVSFEPNIETVTLENKPRPLGLRNAGSEEPIAFISDGKPLGVKDGVPYARFHFKMPGTLLKIKVLRDDNISRTHKYYLQTNALHPVGVFCPINADNSIKSCSDVSKWWESSSVSYYNYNVEKPEYDVYRLRLDGTSEDAVTITEKDGTKYDLWYVWGMQTGTNATETLMGSLTGGYILKHYNNKKARGPFVSKYNFSKDNGKMRTITVKVNDSEPYPSFNFLNFLSRAAKHNLGAPKTWWDNDLYLQNDRWPNTQFEFRKGANGDVWYKWEEGMQHKKSMPENYVWHMPSLQELTTLFPFPSTDNKWKDQAWDIYFGDPKKNTFKDKYRLWTEWMTLYADLEESNEYMFVRDLFPNNGGDLAEEQMKNVNMEGFHSLFLTKGGTTYSIRFFNSKYYGSKLCCAYKWETKNWPDCQWTSENQLIITSRWIGAAPLRIDDIANENWWNGEESKYNVVRKLPFQKECTSQTGKYANDHSAMTIMAGNTYQGTAYSGHWFRAVSKHLKGTFQRKSYVQKGLIHPFCNRQMCTEKGTWKGLINEEGTGHGTGRQWDLPKTGLDTNPR
ncbi:hypothetical protein HMPREF9018_1526 [Prevotella amnii CRIS 21A-A]|uniref:Lipoprotein n=1 Tax=Prevotella amnii CRIS 21A-A TaxID=679191 RepID=E1GT35_9BACT|nr:hypothetical protein [Prevotella amnii]EFN92193.1 hypothetical protein HMPREF9018_1526 [Prevotella amnii CRIS 21A-A]